MNSYDELLNMLRNGATVDELATQMAKDLNAAQDAYVQEQAAKVLDVTQAKWDSADAIASVLNYHIKTFYPDWNVSPMTADDIIDLGDAVNDLIVSMRELEAFLGDAKDKVKTTAKSKVADPIADFLAGYGLL